MPGESPTPTAPAHGGVGKPRAAGGGWEDRRRRRPNWRTPVLAVCSCAELDDAEHRWVGLCQLPYGGGDISQ